MHNAIQHFRANIARVHALGGLRQALSRLTTSAIDTSDIMRAQIVLTVSALDHYIHEITRLGMLEVFSGSRPATPAFRRFQIFMDAAMAGIAGAGGHYWFEAEIRERHSFLAFQQPDKVADAIRLISPRELWPEVAASMSMGVTAQDLKDRLRLIIDRRNKIAHEADLDPSYPGTRWPIAATDVENTIIFVTDICEAIHAVVT